MSKMKTNRGAAKRFKVTASGKVRFNRAKRRHILSKKSTSWKRHARGGGTLAEPDAKLVRRLIPYK
ncbi:MAG: 50S ribosomal protein L35 [Myxococcota bacterium]|nr:50S ribosomal protein L35 [Myxococcota bacterium]